MNPPVSKFTPKIYREKTSSNSDLSTKKDEVQVFCRLRPLSNEVDSEAEEGSTVKLLSPTLLALSTPREFKGIAKSVHCKFRHIFTAFASQNEIFEHVAFPLLEDLLKGKNGLLFTYGVTGSGKTFTLNGDKDNPGIMPKSIYTIFNTIENLQTPKFTVKSDRMNGFEVQSECDAIEDKLKELRQVTTPRSARKAKPYSNDGIRIMSIDENSLYAIFVSYIEIYNNNVYDLLDEQHMQGKILREDAQKNMYVNGMVELEVKSAEEAFAVFESGKKRKKMGMTALNSESSRSHSIFNIRVVQLKQSVLNEEGREIVPDSNQIIVSQLSLVDLAGSERSNRAQTVGKALKEASKINNSLLTLRTCLEILRNNQKTGANRLVPYRDSRLSLLFKNYFEGEGKVAMIVCLNPSNEDIEENWQVVKFAELTQDVKITRAEPKYYTPIKKTIGKKLESTSSVSSNKTNKTMSRLSALPKIKLTFSNFEADLGMFSKFLNTLETRKKQHEELDGDLEKKREHFRNRLLNIHQDTVLVKSDLKSAKASLTKEKKRAANFGTKLADTEAANTELVAKNKELEETIRNLKNTIREKDVKINQKILEKEKTKQRLVLTEEKMTQELDQKLRRQRQYLDSAMKAKDSKIEKAMQILTNKNVVVESEQVEEKENHDYEPQQTPIKKHVPRKNAGAGHTPAAPRNRRSRSAGEVWLEHNAVKPVPLGTVLQPSMKKRKSVTKLSKASEVTNPKQSKYCLIAQEKDTDGEVETKVYKGDILSTVSGGAQVVFNDVECLHQQSPTK